MVSPDTLSPFAVLLVLGGGCSLAWWSSGGVALLAFECPWHLHHRCMLSPLYIALWVLCVCVCVHVVVSDNLFYPPLATIASEHFYSVVLF